MQLTQANSSTTTTAITPTAQQIQIRDIAQLYLRVQQNTQFLTNIVRHQHARMHKPLTLDTVNLNPISFLNLIVQISYLLYTCYLKKVSIYISKQVYINNYNYNYQKECPEVIIQFILEKQFIILKQNKQVEIQKEFNLINVYKYQNAYADIVGNFIKYYLQIMKQYINKQQQIKYKYKQKQKKIINVDKNIINQLQSFENVFGLIYTISQKGIKPKQLISKLQQTQIFRSHSYLLRTLLSSLFETVRKSGKFQAIVRQMKRKQYILINQSQANIIQPELLNQSVNDFIRYLIIENLVQVPSSVRLVLVPIESIKGSIKNKQEKVCEVYTVKNDKVLKDGKKMRDQSIPVSTEDQGTTNSSENQRNTQNVFSFQYVVKQNIINIIYISSIEINIENCDAILFLCGNISLEQNNIIVECIQKQTAKSKKKQKLVGFRVVQHLSYKSTPFINILLMIDRAMIIGKVLQTQIKKKNYKIEDTIKFSVATKRINHLSNLFIKKVQRLYQSIEVK